MNTRRELAEIKKLIDQAQVRIAALLEVQPKPTPGKPPRPGFNQNTAMSIWRVWDKLKAKGIFSATQAKSIATERWEGFPLPSDSAFSSILSGWAKDEYLQIVRQGKGRLPTVYKVRA